MADLEGRTLGRYELQQLMGRGGMADVYLAYDPHFEREVAVKVFKREDEDLLRRFIREARLMASLSNAHLMPVYDTGMSQLDGVHVYYIVMPFMDGGTLRSLVRHSPISLKQACNYLNDIADALDYMHQQGIIHRDIKSSNVLLDADERCYLADFGIARTSTDATQLTSTGNVLGTVDYIAPELFESNHRADARSDYYSLGVLLYEMVTGHLPFVGDNQIAVVAMHMSKRPPSPRTYIPTLSPQVERVLMKALEKRPELRYNSATELAEAFYQAIHAPRTQLLPESETIREQKRTVPRTPVILPSPPVTYAPEPMAAQHSGYYQAAPSQYPMQTTMYPAHQQRKHDAGRAQARIITVLVIIALLAVLGPMVYVMISNGQMAMIIPGTATATPDIQATSNAATSTAVQQGKNATATADAQGTAIAQSTATAQAHATATATAQRQATATAQAAATATVQAQASATAGVFQTATAGTPAYSDPLTSANNPTTQAAQWDDNGSCSFQADGYHVRTGLLDSFKGCYESQNQYQNFAAQVDLSILKGSTGGLFFRLGVGPLGTYQGYLFEVNNQGQYRISLSDNFSSNNITTLRDWTSSSSLKTGSTKNRLEVLARNNTLLFYINGVYQPDPIKDSTYSSGNIGFLATDNNQGERANVVYSNLNIYPLS